MLFNILKISLILVAVSVVLAKCSLLATSAIMDKYPGTRYISDLERVGNKMYYFSKEKLSWYYAYLKCRSFGLNLASIDYFDQFALSKYLLDNYLSLGRVWWSSGSDLHSKGNFSWYGTGKAIKFADWVPGQPDNFNGTERCVNLKYHQQSYKMNDCDCNRLSFYICETKRAEALIAALY